MSTLPYAFARDNEGVKLMAGIEFDRQAFIPSVGPKERSTFQIVGPIVMLLASSLMCYVGYKIFLVKTQESDLAAANTRVQQLEQQLTDMQKRVETVEKHRKPAPAEATPAAPAGTQSAALAAKPRTVYRIAAASALPPQSKHATTTDASPTKTPLVTSPELASAVAANHEAWEATTNRLADVVGVVGTQQGEISATREAVNQLLSQSHRQAMSFELGRGETRTPVGPVTLQLKSADSRNQHYSLCVFFSEQKCIELKDRALNEVVVLVIEKNSPPLELVATKILRDQIAGYLEVPSGAQ